uniref:TPR_REGION domain-containing protein n=1 Tax=Panagrellus redivivus TaxID=6233 RepID=A0A7E4ZUT6_PANRE
MSNSSITIPDSERFIQLHVSDKGGLGNQMYRLASLYGIGKVVNRKPSLNASYVVNQVLAAELQTLFPRLFDTVAFEKAKNGTKAFTIFGRDCCSYADPRIMHDSNATWLLMGGSYYQSYKYFHEYRDEVRDMFQFGPEVMGTVDAYASKLFGNDKSHKFCIHIRRDDFIDHKNLESRTDFVVPAAFRAYEFLRINFEYNNVSAVFIGAKPDFMEALNITQNFSYFDNVYNASLSSRGEDLAFGATYCDSFLITASGSSFAWWMAYLGKPTMPIFYNGQVGKDRNHFKDYSDYDMFPSEWHKMELNRTTEEGFLDCVYETQNRIPEIFDDKTSLQRPPPNLRGSMDGPRGYHACDERADPGLSTKPNKMSKKSTVKSCQVMVLGMNKSGKKTLMKALEVVQNKQYSTPVQRECFTKSVHKFIIEQMKYLVEKREPRSAQTYKELTVGWEANDSEETRSTLFNATREIFGRISSADGFEDFTHSDLVVNHLEILQQMDRVFADDYKPSVDDFLRTAETFIQHVVVPHGSMKYQFHFPKTIKYHEVEKVVYVIDANASRDTLEKGRDAFVAFCNNDPDMWVELCINKTELLHTRTPKAFTAFGYHDDVYNKNSTLTTFLETKLMEGLSEERKKTIGVRFTNFSESKHNRIELEAMFKRWHDRDVQSA